MSRMRRLSSSINRRTSCCRFDTVRVGQKAPHFFRVSRRKNSGRRVLELDAASGLEIGVVGHPLDTFGSTLVDMGDIGQCGANGNRSVVGDNREIGNEFSNQQSTAHMSSSMVCCL